MLNKKYRLSVLTLSCLLLIHLFGSPGYGASQDTEWAQYRGPNRDGIALSSPAIKPWPKGGQPHEVWKRPLGEGFSGISLAGDRLLTAFTEEGATFVAAFDKATGEEIWRTNIGAAFEEEMGNGPRSTPTIDGELAYILNSHGALFCFRVDSGEKVWEVSLTEEFKIGRPRRGFSTSPIIRGDTLILHGGGATAAFLGLDKKTGKTLWQTGDSIAGHSSPFAAVINGKEQFVFTITRLIEKDGERQLLEEAVSVSADGEVLWRGPSLSQIIAMPVFVPPNKVFISSSVEKGCMLIQVSADGSVDTVWHNKEMRNHFNSSVCYLGHIYGFSSSTLKCLVADTAERKWSKRGFGKGSLIIADGKLLILSDRGKLGMIEATPSGYKELAQAQVLNGKSWTSPTYSEGRIYLRNQKEMACYDLTK